MQLARLDIHSVRNIQEASLSLHPTCNLILGDNGGGKTTLLEAIHLLALGRSFRSRQSDSVISYEASKFACFGEVWAQNQKITLGIEKTREGHVTCKRQGERCARLSDFATVLPVQIITPETFRLLIAGAEERRRFLDWGVFHVEPSFANLCQAYQRALKQRNAALKQRRGKSEVLLWDPELARCGERIALLRETYLAALLPFIQATCVKWLPELELEVAYFAGWKEGTMTDALASGFYKDAAVGFTSVGPHRAELAIRVKGFAAHQVLSRGQQKLFIFSLYLAQAEQLSRQQGKKSVFLIDDLASELDSHNRHQLLQALAANEHQVFLTAIEENSLNPSLFSSGHKMFHVEHGVIR